MGRMENPNRIILYNGHIYYSTYIHRIFHWRKIRGTRNFSCFHAETEHTYTERLSRAIRLADRERFTTIRRNYVLILRIYCDIHYYV